jgi:hypothetical protein
MPLAFLFAAGWGLGFGWTHPSMRDVYQKCVLM